MRALTGLIVVGVALALPAAAPATTQRLTGTLKDGTGKVSFDVIYKSRQGEPVPVKLRRIHLRGVPGKCGPVPLPRKSFSFRSVKVKDYYFFLGTGLPGDNLILTGRVDRTRIRVRGSVSSELPNPDDPDGRPCIYSGDFTVRGR